MVGEFTTHLTRVSTHGHFGRIYLFPPPKGPRLLVAGHRGAPCAHGAAPALLLHCDGGLAGDPQGGPRFCESGLSGGGKLGSFFLPTNQPIKTSLGFPSLASLASTTIKHHTCHVQKTTSPKVNGDGPSTLYGFLSTYNPPILISTRGPTAIGSSLRSFHHTPLPSLPQATGHSTCDLLSKGGSTYPLFISLGFGGFQPTLQGVYTPFGKRGMNIRPFELVCPSM